MIISSESTVFSYWNDTHGCGGPVELVGDCLALWGWNIPEKFRNFDHLWFEWKPCLCCFNCVRWQTVLAKLRWSVLMMVSSFYNTSLCIWVSKLAAWLSGIDVSLWLADFPDMRLIYGWRVTTSWVRRPLWVNQPGQINLLPSVGRGMSSISVARWVKLLAAVSPSSECLYVGKADVVYLQVTLCDPHLSA